MNRVNLIVVFLLCLVLTGCGTAARLRKADRRFDYGEYYSASEIYRKTQSKISSKKQRKLKGEVSFKTAECYRHLNSHQKAARAYMYAARYNYRDSILYLNLAKSSLATGKYKDAKENFDKYLQSNPSSVEAQNGLYSAQNADSLSKIKTRYIVAESKEFNARRNSSFSPSFMGSEATSIVITSNRDNKNNKKNSGITGVANNDIFISRLNNSGKWESFEAMDELINTSADEGVTSVSADGKTLYFTRCEEGNVAGEIYQTTRSGGEWTEPTQILLFSDTSITCAHPAISPDGSMLYFVSDSEYGGYGNKDIWVAYSENGAWSAPLNLGDQINTEGNEMFPYVAGDGTLYFASDGHKGLGGLDIYRATQDSAMNWTVENMLSPINSMYDDYGIALISPSEGYFSSNRNQKRFVDRIYRFDLPDLVYTVSGKVIDDKGEPLGTSTVRLVGDNGDNIKSRSKKDGTFSINLALNTKYVMMASHRGYLNATYSFDTEGLKDSKTYENDFVLSSISKPVQMDNIFYEFGKWTLSPESEDGLNALVKILNDNPNIAMEISAHTDMVGNEKTNLELSQKRAQSVVDYLLKAGIELERITPKGYGESSPVVVTQDISKKYPFLKVNDVLTEEYIEQLSEKQQEICNQINRRTEFKVTKTTYKLY
ncbi:MAG: OmpA family protein [bacterium]